VSITCIEDQLRRDEAVRQFAYDDANAETLTKGGTLRGNLTIGIGRNLSAKGISAAEQNYLLSNDLAEVNAAIEAEFSWAQSLDPVRFGAMQNLVFNMGSHALAGFPKFLAAMQASDWSTAKTELLDSAADHEEPERIQRLALQIESGYWQ
jgi:lysozyme